MEVSLHRPTYREAVIHWNIDPKHLSEGLSIFIEVRNLSSGEEFAFLTEAKQTGSFELPLEIVRAGQEYSLKVRLMGVVLFTSDKKTGTLGHKLKICQTVDFRAELTHQELSLLLNAADNFSRPKRHPMLISYFYRNKPPHYFEDIWTSHQNVMKVYMKDNNGDQASNINGKIQGLFFSTSADRTTGMPPLMSHYGIRRLLIPAKLMFYTAPNLYFADFYCNNLAHYVTLVMTRSGSPVDDFCREKLLRLSSSSNPFLYQRESDGEVVNNAGVWVEVLYTENIDINQVCLQGAFFWPNDVPSTGTSRPGGIPKNPRCKICNLYST